MLSGVCFLIKVLNKVDITAKRLIKWSNRYFEKPQELNSLIQFCQANDFKSALVTSIDKQGIKEIGDLHFTFVPSSLYAFNIGENTLKMKSTAY